MLGELAGGHPARVPRDDLVIEAGESPPVLADQYWVETPVTITRNRKLKLAGIG